MERVRRRYWTWAVTLFAGTVIFAAAISGVFQLAVLALPSYREEISAWVTRVADRPVDIGGIGLVWRGVYPRLDLTDITLYDEDGSEALTADRVSLGFSSTRLLLGELMPTRIELNGLSLAADIDEEGRLSVAGFDALGGEAFPKNDRLLKELRRFQRVRLRNCEVRFTHAGLGRSPLEFTLVDGEIDRTRSGFDAEADIKLPPAYGERVDLAASIDGDIADPRSWSGDFSAEMLRLAPQAWLRNWLLPGAQVQATELGLHAEGELGQGRLQKMQLRAESDAFVVARAGRAWQGKELDAEVTVAADGAGWRLDIDHFEQDDLPLLRGGLRYRRLADEGYELDADVDDLQLGRLTPWLAYLRAAPPELRRAAGLGGELDGLVLRLRKAGDGLHYSLRSDFRDIALAADPALGLRKLNGQFSTTEAEGRLKLAGTPVELRLPRLFAAPLPFDALSAELQWQRTAAGWTLRAPDFAWRLAGSKGSGRLELQLPQDEAAAPVMDLAARFSADDATALKPWMPLHWGEHTREWLQRAIQAGRVPRADLLIRGALPDFPFTRKNDGEWKLDIDVSGARLAYAPDWPALTDVDAHLAFRGNGLEVRADSAKISGNQVDQARAVIADFHDSLLQVDGSVAGETARFYDFLRNSPLRHNLAGLINRTRASGPARVGVHLDIPLHKVDDTQVSGTVGLDGVQLFYEGLEQPVDDIRGELSFTGHGLQSPHLDARFSDLVLDARIEPRPKTAGVVVVEFPFAPKASGGVSDFIPDIVRGRLSGESRWRAELPLDAADAALVLNSDLRGTAVQLPPPLGKLAAETSPIRLSLGSDATAPLRIKLDYGQRLGVDVAYAREGQAVKPRAAQLRLGGGMPPPAEGRGMVVSGDLPELEVGLWGAVLSAPGPGASAGGKAGGMEGLALREVDLNVSRWLFDDAIVGAARMRWTPTPEGWRAELGGDGVEGELRYAQAGAGALSARLKRLSLQVRPPPAIASGAQAEPSPRDPRQWPLLDFDVQRLQAADLELGRLQMRSSRISDGQRLDLMSISGGKLSLDASGSWQRNASGSTATLKFELASPEVAAVLQALGYNPTLSAKSSRFTGELGWTAAPRLDWQQASGRIRLDVENGALKAVEPGAGRVLGLLNLYAIPRRLLLDFRDVVSSGLGFDKLSGSFQLGEGQARTSDMEIRSTSLRMEIRGRIGLAARDLDQAIKVYPDVSSGVTLGAALLAGPAVGALVLVAQQVLDKPIEQVTQLSYRVTGNWDNPRVERGSGN
ncbi:TIGR02099 family protein [Solimonas sp. K1W22B-7]|uniref:YhdP family protein n=1 Tax=Solimonas sp. K1W22B-7 TaxID=2303331 RepID=UPI000E3328E1|nr:YhdP family protein [Solimonas sp. K1W22B-7]AXQ28265.1 TIGR02099 family protein [Solimonas sp. K1W22B-7]